MTPSKKTTNRKQIKLSEEAFSDFKNSLLPGEKHNEAIIRLCKADDVGVKMGQGGKEKLMRVNNVDAGGVQVGGSDPGGNVVPSGTDSKGVNASDGDIALDETLSKFGLNKGDLGTIVKGFKTLFGFRSRHEPNEKRWPDVLTPSVLKAVVWGIVAVVLGLECIRYVVPLLLEVFF